MQLEELVPKEDSIHLLLERYYQVACLLPIEVPISTIEIGDQCCPVYLTEHDLKRMTPADLLRPILVDLDHRLITCECRVRARRLQGHKTVLIKTLNLQGILKGERPMDAVVSTFPISEQVAIMKAFERLMGERKGRPSAQENRSKCAEFFIEGRTESFLAEKMSFGSRDTYRRADKVVKKGEPRLIQHMDLNELSISKAAEWAVLSPQEQYQKLNTWKGQSH